MMLRVTDDKEQWLHLKKILRHWEEENKMKLLTHTQIKQADHIQ